jgi:hypothetical protein
VSDLSSLVTLLAANYSGGSSWKQGFATFVAAGSQSTVKFFGLGGLRHIGIDNLVMFEACGSTVLPCSARNLLIDGSFETGAFVNNPPNGNGAQTMPPGSTSISGWTTTDAESAWVTVPNSYVIRFPQDGRFYVDLTGFHDSIPYAGITQSFTTIPSTRYTVTFFYQRDGSGSAVDLLVTDVASSLLISSTTFSGAGSWQLGSANFLAAGSQTNLKLRGAALTNIVNIGVDNVVVTQLCPGTTTVPSGTAPPTICSPQTCAGCCDADGVCQLFSSQSNSRCGANGSKCVDCTTNGGSCGSVGNCSFSVVCCGTPGFSPAIAVPTTSPICLLSLRWNLPCLSVPNPLMCSQTNPQIQTGAVSGNSLSLYNITLRFRGIVEPKIYYGGSSIGGQGAFYAGGNPANDSNNIYALTVSDPPQKFYLNADLPLVVNVIDFIVSFMIHGGASISLTANTGSLQPICWHMFFFFQLIFCSVDGFGGANIDSLKVPNISPAPQAYNGQFVQLDLVSMSSLTGMCASSTPQPCLRAGLLPYLVKGETSGPRYIFHHPPVVFWKRRQTICLPCASSVRIQSTPSGVSGLWVQEALVVDVGDRRIGVFVFGTYNPKYAMIDAYIAAFGSYTYWGTNATRRTGPAIPIGILGAGSHNVTISFIRAGVSYADASAIYLVSDTKCGNEATAATTTPVIFTNPATVPSTAPVTTTFPTTTAAATSVGTSAAATLTPSSISISIDAVSVVITITFSSPVSQSQIQQLIVSVTNLVGTSVTVIVQISKKRDPIDSSVVSFSLNGPNAGGAANLIGRTLDDDPAFFYRFDASLPLVTGFGSQLSETDFNATEFDNDRNATSQPATAGQMTSLSQIGETTRPAVAAALFVSFSLMAAILLVGVV